MTAPNLQLRELLPGQGQPHLSLNDSLKVLDALMPRDVGSVMTISSPPDPGLAGRVHIVGPNPTGDWATHENHVAIWLNTAGWRFIVPTLGLMMWDRGNARLVVYTGRSAGPWEYLGS